MVSTSPSRTRTTVAVLGVVYLIFNEGYTASSGARLVRDDLCAEAIRLVRHERDQQAPEANGLGAEILAD